MNICKHCLDPIVWHAGNGGQWIGKLAGRDWMKCGGHENAPRHEPVDHDDTCLACHRPLVWVDGSRRRGGGLAIWITAGGTRGTTHCPDNRTRAHVPTSDPDRVRAWLDA